MSSLLFFAPLAFAGLSMLVSSSVDLKVGEYKNECQYTVPKQRKTTNKASVMFNIHMNINTCKAFVFPELVQLELINLVDVAVDGELQIFHVLVLRGTVTLQQNFNVASLPCFTIVLPCHCFPPPPVGEEQCLVKVLLNALSGSHFGKKDFTPPVYW